MSRKRPASPTSAAKPADATAPTAVKSDSVRVVIPGQGLQPRPAAEAAALIASGAARPATPRDLAVAGVED